jgi:hypothetical protein
LLSRKGELLTGYEENGMRLEWRREGAPDTKMEVEKARANDKVIRVKKEDPLTMRLK